MGRKKSVLIVLLVLLICIPVYILTNTVVIRDRQLPQKVRMIHMYYEAPGASWDTQFDVDITDPLQIRGIMDELEGSYLRVPIPASFFRNEKKQFELCVSWRIDDDMDVDVRSNGRVVINGKPYICLDDDTNELYEELLEISRKYK